MRIHAQKTLSGVLEKNQNFERPEEEKGTCNLGKVENWVIFTEGILWLKRKRVL